MPQHDEQVQRAIDVITSDVERLSAEVEAAVVMELVTRWLGSTTSGGPRGTQDPAARRAGWV